MKQDPKITPDNALTIVATELRHIRRTLLLIAAAQGISTVPSNERVAEVSKRLAETIGVELEGG